MGVLSGGLADGAGVVVEDWADDAPLAVLQNVAVPKMVYSERAVLTNTSPSIPYLLYTAGISLLFLQKTQWPTVEAPAGLRGRRGGGGCSGGLRTPAPAAMFPALCSVPLLLLSSTVLDPSPSLLVAVSARRCLSKEGTFKISISASNLELSGYRIAARNILLLFISPYLVLESGSMPILALSSSYLEGVLLPMAAAADGERTKDDGNGRGVLKPTRTKTFFNF